ncbi:hypothetical protein QCA50_014695 [Cerrena zonata]|uniref:Protein kinase domain-containing protein n=1 Tax=Cerrena zonata TaxID=2478898 RepID=A0AAW0FRB5_9APHY
MDGAVSGLLNLFSNVVQYCYSQLQKMKTNTQECHVLASFIQRIHELVKSRSKSGLAPHLRSEIKELSGFLSEFVSTVGSMSDKSWLKRFWWQDEITRRIGLTYRRIQNTLDLFQLEENIHSVSRKGEKARQADSQQLRQTIEPYLGDSDAIFKLLDIRPEEIPEAKILVQKLLTRLQQSTEKRFFEQALYALQSRSGHFGLDDADDFSITSLEVIRTPRQLGTGGFGTVYEGRVIGIKAVAIKELDGVPESIVWQEIKTWKRLKHEHIVDLIGAAPSANPPFIVCEYMENGEAMGYLARNPGADRKLLLHDSSLGLLYLHYHYVIHGDLKAANILIDAEGRARLSDFGLSIVRSHSSRLRQTKKVAGPLYGTAPWMAPELLKGERISVASDVYGFAMTMYEVYSGMVPFANIANDAAILLSSIVDRRIRPSRPPSVSGTTSLDDDVWDVMERSWNHEPSRRPKVSDIASILGRHRGRATQQATGAPVKVNDPKPAVPPKGQTHRPNDNDTIQFPVPGIEGVPLENLNGCYSENSLPSTSRSTDKEDNHKVQSSSTPANYFVGGWRQEAKRTMADPSTTPHISTHALTHQLSQVQISSSTRNTSKPPNLSRPWERLRDYFFKWTESWDYQTLSVAHTSTQPNYVVNDIALTIWIMQMYKRRLRYLWSERLYDVVEVFTVPPLYTAKINRCLVGNSDKTLEQQGITAALKVLCDLWSVVRHGENAEPKVVLVVGQHAKDKSRWLVHKISLLDGNICTYETSNNESPPTANELPSGWWSVICSLWPHVRHRPTLSTRIIYRSNQPAYESSLSAAITWRNLLQDLRPDREADLHETRSSIRRETEILLHSRFNVEYVRTT